MFNPTREQVRQFFCDCYAKHAANLPATALESMAIDWIIEHSHYHALLADRDQALGADFQAGSGQSNPFLHLAMHLSISEQLSIDQPPGIRDAYGRLLQRYGDAHEAAHRIMECLGETIWRAERSGAAPDSAAYLECMRRRAGRAA